MGPYWLRYLGNAALAAAVLVGLPAVVIAPLYIWGPLGFAVGLGLLIVTAASIAARRVTKR